MWKQREIALKPKSRGFSIITNEVIRKIANDIEDVRIGLLHLFLQHTSASLAINENADPSVRDDLEQYMNEIVPECPDTFSPTHTYEGPDDCTSHCKSVILGNQITIPITDGRLNLGVWQGLYLCEHRDHGGSRRIIATIHGE
ncbi:hypothetical protein PCE1_000969 [Barthelona sp. PCE]